MRVKSVEDLTGLLESFLLNSFHQYCTKNEILHYRFLKIDQLLK